MLQEKLKSPDQFWNVKGQEEEFLKRIGSQIDQTERVINLAKKLASLAGAPGFQEYVKAIEDLKTATMDSLLVSNDPREVMDLRARAKAFQDVLGLMTSNQSALKALASKLETLQNHRNLVASRMPFLGGQKKS